MRMNLLRSVISVVACVFCFLSCFLSVNAFASDGRVVYQCHAPANPERHIKKAATITIKEVNHQLETYIQPQGLDQAVKIGTAKYAVFTKTNPEEANAVEEITGNYHEPDVSGLLTNSVVTSVEIYAVSSLVDSASEELYVYRFVNEMGQQIGGTFAQGGMASRCLPESTTEKMPKSAPNNTPKFTPARTPKNPLSSSINSMDLFSQLSKQLPRGQYSGKTKSKKDCTVDIKISSSSEYGQIYQVSYTQDGRVKREFDLRQNNENYVTTWAFDAKREHLVEVIGDDGKKTTDIPSYVNVTDRNPVTSIAVGRGQSMKSEETYWEGWEKQFQLNIEADQSGKITRIQMGTMNAGSVGYGYVTCYFK